MKILIRTDASVKIGTGHVFRCLTLANILKDRGCKVTFCLIDISNSLNNKIVDLGHDLKLLPTNKILNKYHPEEEWVKKDQINDCEMAIDVCQSFYDLVIIDHYGLSIFWEKHSKKFAKKILVIDDLLTRKHKCDFFLNQNLGFEISDYNLLINNSCISFFGPQYAILREEFTKSKDSSLRRKESKTKNKIMISMGGADVDNVTKKILQIIGKLNLQTSFEIDVILGSANPWIKEVALFLKELKVNTKLHIDTQEISQIMSESDIAIGAGGSTSWERCCLGLPSIIISLAENQIAISKSLHACGAALYIGGLNQNNFDSKLVNAINTLLTDSILYEKMSRKSASIVDGHGTDKLIESLIINN